MCIARFQYTGRMLRDDYHLPFGMNKAKILALFLFFNTANMVWIAWRCTKPFLFLLLSINYFACLNKWLKYLIPPTYGLLATTRETTYSVRLIIAGLVAGSRPPSSSSISVAPSDHYKHQFMWNSIKSICLSVWTMNDLISVSGCLSWAVYCYLNKD